MPSTFQKQKTTQFMGINLTTMNKEAIDEKDEFNQMSFTVKDLSK